VLPALTAVLAGAALAAAATVLANSAGQSAADPTGFDIALTDAQAPAVNGDLRRPEPVAPSTRTATPTTTVPPVTTSAAPPPVTTTEPAPPPTETEDPPVTTASDPTQAVVDSVNAARQDAGCGPLTVDADLTEAAQNHSTDMSNRDFFSHTTPEGVTFDQRIRNAGYAKPGAENIAKGASKAADVMRMWMESPGHRANILNCDLNTIGVGLAREGFYWTQDFGY
jgi:uncharacterized protein YkwD